MTQLAQAQAIAEYKVIDAGIWIVRPAVDAANPGRTVQAVPPIFQATMAAIPARGLVLAATASATVTVASRRTVTEPRALGGTCSVKVGTKGTVRREAAVTIKALIAVRKLRLALRVGTLD